MGFYLNKGKDILGPVYGTIAIVLAATAPYLILVALAVIVFLNVKNGEK